MFVTTSTEIKDISVGKVNEFHFKPLIISGKTLGGLEIYSKYWVSLV